MTSRKRRSTSARLRIFFAHNGTCHVCGGRIGVGEAWDIDHVIPLALGGDDDEMNLAPAHRKGCHSTKTSGHDVPAIAKAKRREAAHLAINVPSRRPLQSRGFEKAPKRIRRSTPELARMHPEDTANV